MIAAPQQATRGETGLRSPVMERRTLVRGTNWIGDTIMSLAAFRELRRLFPQDRITLLARRWVAGLFEQQGLVDDVMHPEDLGGWIGVRRRLKGFDRAILFQNAFRAGLQAFLGGVPERIGYATDGRRLLLTRRAVPRIRQLDRHQAYYYLDLLHQTGLSEIDYLDNPEFQPDIRLHPPDVWIEEARRLLNSEGIQQGSLLAVLNPGAAFGSAKRWFPDRYAELADRLIDECGAQVAVVGSNSERAIAEQVRGSMRRGDRLHLLSGKTSLAALAGVIACCDCFVSNDSGPMHLAAALGIPQVAIFGSTDEVATGPFSPKARVLHKHVECSPCLLRECPIDQRCFDRISVEEVFEAVCKVFKHG